jgi:RimJ/RimL family protein N-acetyltransferase
MLLEGKKIFLRDFTPEDITSQYLDWLNDKNLMRYSNQRFLSHTVESSLKYLDSFKSTNNLFLCVLEKNTGKSIGTLTAYISTRHHTADLGILIGDKSVQGKGYGQDAWNSLIRCISTSSKIRKITCGTLEVNKPMQKIAENSGMHLEAKRIAQELVDGIPVDMLYFAKFL